MTRDPDPLSETSVPAEKRRSVVVVGAGVVGLSAALWLLRAGHGVTVVDENPPVDGSDYRRACTFGNAATIAVSACLPLATPGIVRRVPAMLADRRGPLAISWRDLPGMAPWLLSFLKASRPAEFERIVPVLGRLLRLAEAGHASLMAESGVAGLKRSIGCMHLFRGEAALRAAEATFALREREGVRMERLDVAAIRDREPGLAPLYRGGIFFPDCYSIDDPHRYAEGLARAIVARGGRLLRGRAAGIESGPDAVSVVVEGERLSAERIVVAGGAWSKRLAANVGDEIRLGVERGHHVLFPGGETLLTTPTLYPEDGFYMTPLGEGLRSAGTIELGGLDRPPRALRSAVIAEKTRTFLPGLGAPSRDWLGFRPSMPDSLPVIGPSPTEPRVIYAFGHGHLGLTLGGITGRIVADLVGDLPPPVDLAPLRPDRFPRNPFRP